MLRDAVGFATGLRRALRQRAPVEPDQVRRDVADAVADRTARFVQVLDRTVWQNPASPYQPLLSHAGFERNDLAALVRADGVEGALVRLRDEGVHVTYDEWRGATPLRRGSLELHLRPEDFFNPLAPPDAVGRTSGTRSEGTAVSVSFTEVAATAPQYVLRRLVWDAVGAPVALWLPAPPATSAVRKLVWETAAGAPLERWFSQLDPYGADVARRHRAMSRALPWLGRSAGATLPEPEHLPPANPGPALDWCVDALGRSGTAVLTAYASSAVRLASASLERGARLDGLVIEMVGEPTTQAKAAAVRASGAKVMSSYAFTQVGVVGQSCPEAGEEQLHLYDHTATAVPRRVARPDGVEVDALCWTTLGPLARSVLLNVENDDYGRVWRDDEADACSCLFGQLGMRGRVAGVRGISKIVASGVTVPGEVFETLAEQVLPSRFGGGPTDWQFTEGEGVDATSRLVLRADPRIGVLDAVDVRSTVAKVLQRDAPGMLADAVWRGESALELVREPPRAARSGKVLAYQPSTTA